MIVSHMNISGLYESFIYPFPVISFDVVNKGEGGKSVDFPCLILKADQ